MNEPREVIIITKQDRRGQIIGTVRDAETNDLMIAATPDYCLDQCAIRQLEITNAQHVLMMLHNQKRINYEV